MEKQMKKSVVVLIGIIYIASIALVSFFGLKYKVFEEVVYVESVELLNEGLLAPDFEADFDYYALVAPNEQGELRYQIKYRVHPDNATDQSVDFVLEDASGDGVQTTATVDKNGVVIMDSVGTAVIVTVIAKNGSGEKASVSVALFAVDSLDTHTSDFDTLFWS